MSRGEALRIFLGNLETEWPKIEASKSWGPHDPAFTYAVWDISAELVDAQEWASAPLREQCEAMVARMQAEWARRLDIWARANPDRAHLAVIAAANAPFFLAMLPTYSGEERRYREIAEAYEMFWEAAA